MDHSKRTGIANGNGSEGVLVTYAVAYTLAHSGLETVYA